MAISASADESLTADHPDIQKDLSSPSMKGNDRVPGDYSRRNRGRREKAYLDLNDPPRDVNPPFLPNSVRNRGGSLNRRQVRGPSKERGGTQLPTWNETRTTRLRRSKALGEDKTTAAQSHGRRNEKSKESKKRDKSLGRTNSNANPPPYFDAEDEAEDDEGGKFLMERIRANSRCLRARLSSHTRRYVTETGSGLDGTESRGTPKSKSGYNGVYTMHARRQNLRGGTSFDDPPKSRSQENVEVEETSIQLVDEQGHDVDLADQIAIRSQSLDKCPDSNPEILHHHTLSIDGEYARISEDQCTEVSTEGHYAESAEQENLEGNSSKEQSFEASAPPEEEEHEQSAEEYNPPPPESAGDSGQERIEFQVDEPPEIVQEEEEEQQQMIDEERQRLLEEQLQLEQQLQMEEQQLQMEEQQLQMEEQQFLEQEQQFLEEEQQREVEAEADEPENIHEENLEEGQSLSRDGNLTIEVEVKEINNEENAADEAVSSQENRTNFLQIDNSVEYDSYPVYSEQNLPYTSAVEVSVPVPAPAPVSGNTKKRYTSKKRTGESSRGVMRKQEKPQYSRGIYLRKMEHRDQSVSSLKRDRSVSNIKRTRSDGSGLNAVDQSEPVGLSHTRRGGMGSIEKWNTTSSTGDLRELPWDHVSEKERLLNILDGLRIESRSREKQREELLRRIKQLQNRIHQRREQGEENQNQNPDHQNRCLRSLPQFARRADSAAVREVWRKRYIDAKRVTPRLEEECSRLRQELEKLHRELLAKVQAGVWALLTISGKTEKPSNKLSYKIMIARLLQEIEDLSRRVEGTRLKLHTEVKLRAMAEKDVRNLREELLKKKIQVTLTRNQEQAAMGNGIRQQYFISAV